MRVVIPLATGTILGRAKLVAAWLLLSAATGSVGCGGRSDRVIVHGDISFGGVPVQVGTIRFAPIEETVGPVTIAEIEDGSYVAEGHEGVPIGRHRIEIFAYDLTGFVPGPGQQPNQIIPTKYNEESVLTMTVDAASANQNMDFDLEP